MKQIFAIVAILLVGALIVYKAGLFSRTLSLDAITPSSAAQGEVIVLSGAGLDRAPAQTVVFFNEMSVPPSQVNANGIRVQVPQGARSGLVSVVVGDERSNERFFKVAGQAALPPGHPPTGEAQGVMQGATGGARQQAAPNQAPTDNHPAGQGSMAHQFFAPENAESYTDFSLPSLDGGTVTLSDEIGKVILLNFWATWCKPCLEEIPSLERLTKRSETMGLKVLAVSVDESFEDIKKALPDTKLNVLLDAEKKVADQYGTVRFPETWVIDKNGKIVARFIGSRNWDSPTFVNFFSIILKSGTLPAGMGASAQGTASPHTGMGMQNPHEGMENPHKGMENPHKGMENPHKGMENPHKGMTEE